LEVIREGGVGLLGRAGVAELSDEEAGMRALRLLDAVEHGAELVGGVLLVALDLELDERGVSARRDLTGVPRSERRLDVLNRRHFGNTRDDVPDRGVEGRRARSSGPALDQDAL